MSINFVRSLSSHRLILALSYGFLPGLVVGSVVINAAVIDTTNAKAMGFEVSVVTSSTSPKTSARIAYPPEVDGVWAASSVDIVYYDNNYEKRFIQPIELAGRERRSIKFLFDKQDGESDVDAIFSYSCIDENIRCKGWPYRQYHIISIVSFEPEK